VACNLVLSFVLSNMKEFSNSQACHVHFKSAWYSVLKTVLDKDIETTVHKQEVMPYGHLITATVMTLGVCQGQSLIFSILTSTLHVSTLSEYL